MRDLLEHAVLGGTAVNPNRDIASGNCLPLLLRCTSASSCLLDLIHFSYYQGEPQFPNEPPRTGMAGYAPHTDSVAQYGPRRASWVVVGGMGMQSGFRLCIEFEVDWRASGEGCQQNRPSWRVIVSAVTDAMCREVSRVRRSWRWERHRVVTGCRSVWIRWNGSGPAFPDRMCMVAWRCGWRTNQSSSDIEGSATCNIVRGQIDNRSQSGIQGAPAAGG